MDRDRFILSLVRRGWPLALALQEAERLEQRAQAAGWAETWVGKRYSLCVWRGHGGEWRYGLWSPAEARLRRRLDTSWKRANDAVGRLMGARDERRRNRRRAMAPPE